MARLGDICIINPRAPEFDSKHLVSFVPMQKVTENGEIDASEWKEYNEVKKGFTYFQENDVLFAKITPCMENGKGAVATALKNGVGFGSTEFHVLRPISELSDSKWLYYVTVWDAFRKECEKNMTGSAGQKRVPKSFIENFEISLPSFSEQRYMASVLDKISNLIALRKQQFDKLDELVKARFVEMFGDPIINSKGWSSTVLGKLCDVGSSKRIFEKEYVTEGIPFYRTKEIVELSKGNRITTELFISEERFDEIKEEYEVPGKDDLLISAVGTIGVIWIVDGKSEFYFKDGNLLRIAASSAFNSVYMKYLLEQLIYNYKSKMSAGTAYAALTIAGLKEMQIYEVPLDMQERFARFYNEVEQSRLTIQQGLDKLEVLKKALMKKFFE